MFTSLNPYQRVVVIKGDDASDLARRLRELTMRFTIVGLGNDTDNRPYALISGDLLLEQPQKQTRKLKGV